MSELDIKMELQNCRAVHSANIRIADLTVLCGPNACGKTMIARCFEDIINVGLNYEYWARRVYWINIWKEIDSFLDIDFYADGHIRSLLDTNDNLILYNEDYQTRTKFERKLKSITEKILEIGNRSDPAESKAGRSFLAFVRAFSPKYDNKTISEVANKLIERIEYIRERIIASIDKRESVIYDFALYGINSFLWESDSVSLSQGPTKIYDSYICTQKEKRSYSREHFIDPGQIIGLDRVLSLANLGSYTPRVYDSDPSIFEQSLSDNSQGLFKVFHDLLGGHLLPEKNDRGDDEWYYHSNSDTFVEPLSECASGIKNLSQLFIAIKRGEIAASTLLILDEPETHLHPSLIVDYAALLIRICKKSKARILITTHSPTLVNALWVISQAEKMADTVNFYIAEKVEGTEQFDYKALKNKIGDIFKDFNEAHRKLAEFEKM